MLACFSQVSFTRAGIADQGPLVSLLTTVFEDATGDQGDEEPFIFISDDDSDSESDENDTSAPTYVCTLNFSAAIGFQRDGRTLRKAGLGAIEKPKKPLLSAKNIRKRLSWCMAHKDWTIDDWKRVVWSDETKINIFNSDGRTWTWIRSGESLKSHHVKMTVKHGGGNIMLWNAITYAGVGWMCKINAYN
ncbi:hypothetical protein G6F48_013398 [Rhizopus delemar]|nr:hypothetical protein G6F48_013398 [Rhizopus delemar]